MNVQLGNAQPGAVAVGVLEAGRADDPGLVAQLTRLVNDVYAVAERGLWRAGAVRTTPSEIAGLIRAEEIVVATVAGQLAGSVRLHEVSDDTSEFGILVSAPDQRGLGIGRALLDFAERDSAERGLRAIQLELLVPRAGTHPSKEFLKGWYGRRGYRRLRTGALDEAYPHLAPLLALPCDLEVHEKPLAAPR